MPSRRYRLDRSVQRHGDVVVGGSPLKLFRLAPTGSALVDRIAADAPVDDSPLVDALLDAGAIHPAFDPPAKGDESGDGAARFGADDVTVVVPTLGRPRDAPTGAIVVDDGSVPPIDGATIRLDDNRGPAAARNAGSALVVTPLVAYVDGDVELPDDWLDALLPHFDDDRVALVAPRVRSAPGPSLLAAYDASHSPLDLGGEPARVSPGSRVGYVPAAAVVCRTEAIREIGGFDEDLRFGEDVDLVWRLVEAGWRVRYEPASEVRHDPRTDWRSWARQRIGYGSSAAPLARRHPGALAPLRMSGWSVASWVSALAGRPIVGGAIATGSAAALVRRLPDVPPRAAFRLGFVGNARAGEQIGHAIRRAWWPVLVVAALRSRFARRALVGALVAARHPIVVVDDVCYSLGVWRGMIAERTVEPIVPQITSWPGRSGATPARDG